MTETCCASISLQDLVALSQMDGQQIIPHHKKLGYGEIPGLQKLRNNIALLHSDEANPLPHDNVLITPGAIAANMLTFYGLVGKGDHVICQHPTYQQLYSVPSSLGADVDLWKALPENDWIPKINDLKALIKQNTKMIVIKYVVLERMQANLTKIVTRQIQQEQYYLSNIWGR
jgi:aspartate/methionine/tyrosine aminotransferase